VAASLNLSGSLQNQVVFQFGVLSLANQGFGFQQVFWFNKKAVLFYRWQFQNWFLFLAQVSAQPL
jgi:hypothetical protein